MSHVFRLMSETKAANYSTFEPAFHRFDRKAYIFYSACAGDVTKSGKVSPGKLSPNSVRGEGKLSTLWEFSVDQRCGDSLRVPLQTLVRVVRRRRAGRMLEMRLLVHVTRAYAYAAWIFVFVQPLEDWTGEDDGRLEMMWLRPSVPRWWRLRAPISTALQHSTVWRMYRLDRKKLIITE